MQLVSESEILEGIIKFLEGINPHAKLQNWFNYNYSFAWKVEVSSRIWKFSSIFYLQLQIVSTHAT